MDPVHFKESNRTLLKPEAMTDEECSSLHIFTNDQMCISCWRPTWRERLSILLFGRVWCYVWSGRTQPPISLVGQKTVFQVAAKSLVPG